MFGNMNTAAKGKMHEDELAKILSAVGEQVCVNCTKRSRSVGRLIFIVLIMGY